MNGEYMSLETAKRIKQLETNYKNMQDSALQLDRIVKEKQQEIERLNNIINEIEKAIEYEIEESKFEDDYERADNLDWCLQTIKLLKGEDKE